MKLTRICLLAFLSSSALIGRAQQSQQSTMPPYHQLAHDIFQQLIEINTTVRPQAMSRRLRKR
jgi:hypothetical protein